jgi:hypothetical protein
LRAAKTAIIDKKRVLPLAPRGTIFDTAIPHHYLLTKNARDLLFMNYLKKTDFDWKEGVVELIN